MISLSWATSLFLLVSIIGCQPKPPPIIVKQPTMQRYCVGVKMEPTKKVVAQRKVGMASWMKILYYPVEQKYTMSWESEFSRNYEQHVSGEEAKRLIDAYELETDL